jgi:gamma-glutamyl:cysteine ligase YbdK (ATP-grasp superfamily)
MSDFPLFSVIGIELEYMLVDKNTLNIRPEADLILKSLAGGKQVNEVVFGDIALSNELVMHVLELKNHGPTNPHNPIAASFQKTLIDLQPLLEEHDLLFMPTGAHPWMNPHKETVRWPHGSNEIYNQFDKIFDCSGHGWSNLQSMHVNLPYSNQEEFCQLHNLIRLIVPLIPALAASSPILDGAPTGFLDTRLFFYGQNQQRIPSICGDVIPEFIKTEDEYQQKILTPMYEEIKPHDPQGILQYPWLNSRAAIPKFEPKAIEIRITDSQECILADISIACALFEILSYWQQSSHYYLDKPCSSQALKQVYDAAIKEGFTTYVDNMELCNQWGLPKRSMTLRQIWSHLIEKISTKLEQKQQQALEHILSHGNLSERILRAVEHECNKKTLTRAYGQLTHCLLANEQFIAL